MGHRDHEEGLSGLFEDLEQQAAGIHYAERDAELADRARGEYATVTFGSRVHASLGQDVSLTLLDGTLVEGTLSGAGVDWCAVRSRRSGGDDAWLVRLAGVATARGLSTRAVPEAARPAYARLGFGSALHRLTEESPEVLLRMAHACPRVRVMRIGADFVEVEQGVAGLASPVVVPMAAVLGACPA